jgi:hypothetical protein
MFQNIVVYIKIISTPHKGNQFVTTFITNLIQMVFFYYEKLKKLIDMEGWKT